MKRTLRVLIALIIFGLAVQNWAMNGFRIKS
jgi:hypothetical protein